MLVASIWLVIVTTVYFVVLAAGSDFTYTPIVPLMVNGYCNCTKVESNKSYTMPFKGLFCNWYSSSIGYKNNSNIRSCSKYTFRYAGSSQQSDSCSDLQSNTCSQAYHSDTVRYLMACPNQFDYSSYTFLGNLRFDFETDNSTSTFTDDTFACSQIFNFTLIFSNQMGKDQSKCNCPCTA